MQRFLGFVGFFCLLVWFVCFLAGGGEQLIYRKVEVLDLYSYLSLLKLLDLQGWSISHIGCYKLEAV